VAGHHIAIAPHVVGLPVDRVGDSHRFNADPDPACFLIAGPDPDADTDSDPVLDPGF
jgi:hypothetical protein